MQGWFFPIENFQGIFVVENIKYLPSGHISFVILVDYQSKTSRIRVKIAVASLNKNLSYPGDKFLGIMKLC